MYFFNSTSWCSDLELTGQGCEGVEHMRIEKALPSARAGIQRWIVACMAVLLATAGTARVAQSQTLSSINGTVTDSSGAVVANAKVTVKNDATQVAKTAETSSAGTYTVTDLIPARIR